MIYFTLANKYEKRSLKKGRPFGTQLLLTTMMSSTTTTTIALRLSTRTG